MKDQERNLVQDALYLLGAWERGADADEYVVDLWCLQQAFDVYTKSQNNDTSAERVHESDIRKAAEMALVALDHTARSAVEQYVIEQQVVTFLKQALAQPANQSDCGHKEYRPFCQMCMATKQKPEKEPYADKANQLNSDRMQIDPVTGDVSIGTPSKQEPAEYDAPALYKAKAEREQEPVAWMTNSEQDTTAEYMFCHVQTPMHDIPLYEAPPSKPWVSLTDAEVFDELKAVDSQTARLPLGFKKFAQAIEAALRSKNNG